MIVAIEGISNLKEHIDLQSPVEEEDRELVKEARTKLLVKEEAGKKI
jgi:hypothetical protein